MADERQRVDIGFTGGQVLALRLPPGSYDGLRKAIERDKGGIYDLDAGDSTVSLDLGQVVYLRVETEDHRVGF